MDLSQVIKGPIITERSTQLLEDNRYTFEVARKANKKEIARAVEKFLGKVKVVSVNTMKATKRTKRAGRQRRQSAPRIFKKAIVQLAEGDKIDILPAEKKKKPGKQAK